MVCRWALAIVAGMWASPHLFYYDVGLLALVVVLLLVVAAVVFTAVAWPRLGPGGQLAVVAVGIFVVFGLLTIEPVFRLMGASEDVLPLIRQYMLIWYPGVAFLVIPMVANASIRAGGDTKFPASMMVGARSMLRANWSRRVPFWAAGRRGSPGRPLCCAATSPPHCWSR